MVRQSQGFPTFLRETSMSSSKISDLIKSVVADKKITKEEWEGSLKPELKDVKKATEEMREVLELWANDEFEADGAVRADMRSTLNGAGYDISYSAVPKKDLVPGILDSNMTEVDKDFAVLLAQTGKGQNKTTIAVLDSGFQLDHPALADKEWTNPDEIADNNLDDDNNGLIDDIHGWDFAAGDKDVAGGDHGTHVSGTATRGTDRIQEIALRAFDPLDPAKVAAAIDYACENGARAINMSFKVDDEKEVELVKAAIERHPDVLFLKSAGNDGNLLVEGKGYGGYYDNSKTYGVASYLPMVDIPNMVVVAAADAKGERADYSNYGVPFVTVAMRGSEVYSSVPGSAYEKMDGTSMATPNVTNLVAKCLTLAPKLTPYDVRQILVDTTDKKDTWKDSVVSGGLVNPGRATRLAAMVGMVQHEGMDPQAAADKLELRGEERVNLILMLKNYPVAIPVRPPPVVTPPTTTPTTDPGQVTAPVTTTPATDPGTTPPGTTTPATDPGTTPPTTTPISVQPEPPVVTTPPVVTPPVAEPIQPNPVVTTTPAIDPVPVATTTPATDPVVPTPPATTTTPAESPKPESVRRRGGKR